MYQVHLPQIGLARGQQDAGAVADRLAHMPVAFAA